jgi:hypothetical protein
MKVRNLSFLSIITIAFVRGGFLSTWRGGYRKQAVGPGPPGDGAGITACSAQALQSSLGLADRSE